jgi:hypothetical protein
VSFSPSDAQGLENAKAQQLQDVGISPAGHGIYFRKLDAHIYVPGLLEGLLGSRRWLLGLVILAQSRSRAKRRLRMADWVEEDC